MVHCECVFALSIHAFHLNFRSVFYRISFRRLIFELSIRTSFMIQFNLFPMVHFEMSKGDKKCLRFGLAFNGCINYNIISSFLANLIRIPTLFSRNILRFMLSKVMNLIATWKDTEKAAKDLFPSETNRFLSKRTDRRK